MDHKHYIKHDARRNDRYKQVAFGCLDHVIYPCTMHMKIHAFQLANIVAKALWSIASHRGTSQTKSVNLSSSWKNSPYTLQNSRDSADGSQIRPILVVNNTSPSFVFGFYRNGTEINTSFYLVVCLLPTRPGTGPLWDFQPPVVVWSTNRDRPVMENATLDFTDGGDLILKDAYGTAFRYIRLESDGHLSVYQTQTLPNDTRHSVGGGVIVSSDRIGLYLNDCDYPTKCGSSGVCLDGECSCPGGDSSFFTPFIHIDEHGDDQVTGASKIFCFQELKSATRDFQIKLGRGGFGSVYEGDLADGTKVAVRRLDSIGQGRKEFLAEIKTIGSIHRFNLVRLIGYCAEHSNRLLVYEHMCNGSLNKWVFNPDQAHTLSGEIRKKNHHWLSKGAGGHKRLSEGSVYSFGIVVLQFLFGRKNSDSSQHHTLTDIVKEKAETEELHDLVDGYNEDMQLNKEEARKMIKIAIMTLGEGSTVLTLDMKKPSMPSRMRIFKSQECDLLNIENMDL
ncbi:hypothetical protein RJ640_000416 [Escallonia rubra]|uniref:Protein kinase domain-containing protein n=1 Tax=Escallonia rubra TaxID=112253 RepID=A0AA88QB06_9ASTE|nr:hypothetical protein RJ640_000416 [Escallonia rubra]